MGRSRTCSALNNNVVYWKKKNKKLNKINKNKIIISEYKINNLLSEFNGKKYLKFYIRMFVL